VDPVIGGLVVMLIVTVCAMLLVMVDHVGYQCLIIYVDD
jgi:hypothetical protein